MILLIAIQLITMLRCFRLDFYDLVFKISPADKNITVITANKTRKICTYFKNLNLEHTHTATMDPLVLP